MATRTTPEAAPASAGTPPPQAHRAAGRLRPTLAVLTALVLLLVGAVLSLCTGPIDVSLAQAWSVIAHRGLGMDVAQPEDARIGLFVWSMTVPRIVLAAFVGAGLALVGVAAQALVRNPMADPFVLGVSSGAALGAVAVISFGIGTAGLVWQSAGACAGAMGALVMVLFFGRAAGAGVSPLHLVLSGIAMGHALAGLVGFLLLRRVDPSGTAVQYWLTGHLGSRELDMAWLPALAVLLGGVLLALDGGRMNALLVGDETAASLGVNVAALRWRLIAISAVLGGILVAQSGVIGFVGLVVPHMARILVGNDHRRVIPVAAAGGAAYLVLCDWIAQTVVAPQLVPVGIVAGGFGGPLFLLLIHRSLARQRA